jgi:hypothetical protein
VTDGIRDKDVNTVPLVTHVRTRGPASSTTVFRKGEASRRDIQEGIEGKAIGDAKAPDGEDIGINVPDVIKIYFVIDIDDDAKIRENPRIR